MIKKIIPLAALFFGGYVSAQVGVGVKKPSEATMLDVSAKDKGVLLPRVSLISDTDIVTIKGQHIESLLVYNLGSANMKAGFYYWYQNKWTALMSGATYTDTTNKSFTISDDKEKLVITDSQNNTVSLAIKDIANNSVFVTNLTENSEFVTKLVENKEFITKLGDNIEFVNQITNNNEFVENIINKLEGKYGNVGYDIAKKEFFYIDATGQVQPISWSDLDTVNISFGFDATKDNLVITDSKGNTVQITTDELGKTIANNSVFVTNLTENSEFVTKLVENKEFITKLGDNIEFVNQITNNNEFVENIINKLEGKYGNVGYDVAKKEFFYIDATGQVQPISWSDLDTINISFGFDATKDNLVITDSKGHTVQITTDELGKTIANNSVFVTNLTENSEFVTKLVENKEFITKLGDNIEFVEHITNNNDFVENIINKLEGKYGNVGYDVAKKEFFYIDATGQVQPISWSDLDTVNISFGFDATKDNLIITDSKGHTVQITTDELGKTIANNSVFVTNLTENSEFVTKLVENKEFITKLGDNIEFVEHITNNNEFVENIINKLEGKYGNVGYDVAKKEFFYIDATGQVQPISWSDLDTVNISFGFDATKDNLIITDSKGNTVQITTDELGKTIANNSVFVTNLTENSEFVTKLVENKEFITKLGDNIEFVEHITNNNEFVENIINKLEGKYGNVGYDVAKKEFFYIDATGQVQPISWSDLDTVNISFGFDATKDNLVITDSKGNTVQITTDELGKTIANNSVFVTNLTENSEFVTKLVENKEFITKLGDNIEFVEHITNNNEFVENIINKLEGKYGNVGYDVAKKEFFYIDATGQVQPISWSDLDTVNISFGFDATKDNLIITDSKGNTVQITTDELGKTIANNSVFVTNLTENSEFVTKLVENKEFITKLGDNIEFVEHITNNNEFVENIINKLEGKYGNVGYDVAKKEFFYIDATGQVQPISWSDLDTVNISFGFDATKDNLIITDSKGHTVQITTDELGKTIANNSVFVTNLTENSEFVTKLVENKEFITKLGDNVDFIKQITNNQDFINNIINKLEGDFGNVGYDKDQNKFFYLKDGKVEWIEWSDLDTVNVSFAFDTAKENLIITDSKGNTVQITTDELGKTIANNSVFVTNLTENKEFITKLGDNVDFIKQITNNQDFINNIINKLEGDFGNVGYDKDQNKFFYLKDGKVEWIEWSDLDTVNVSFAFDTAKENLIITDSKGNTVQITTDELGKTIANNSVFVTNLTENKEFITKLGDNVDFIKQITNNQDFINNIINKLEGDFGNVGYDKDQNKFFYLKDGKVEWIEWSDLDTVNVSFAFDTAKENLIITDSKGNTVQITTDELGKTIANNSVFVTNLTENKEFITKLGDNVDFIKQITNNQDFINNIINKLEGDFGNVGYDKDQNKFFYLKDGKVEWIEWSDLDTVNVSFAFDTAKENLIITDSKGNTVQITTDELGKTIANNSVFVTNLTENKEFITKLGDNVDFIKQITNNQDFINNIINKLEGDFGNVGYDKDQNKFFYLKDGKVEWIEWSDLDTVNVSFAFDTAKENLIITDSKGNTVQITTDELGKTIANNSVFVTNLTENKEFITKLGDNVDFIKQITNNQDFINNIINKLEGDFGNVGYDKDQNKFFYLKDGKVEWIEWSDLDTVNVSFAFDTAKENLIITDSKGNTVQITTDELGKTIANNSVFVTNLTENKEFITKLGDNVDFIKQITNNQDFINNIINKLEGDFGNVGYDKDQNKFFYLKDGKVEWIEWSDLDTVNVSFAFDTAKENLIITDSKGNTVQITTDELGKTIANNSVFVTNLTENKEFITKLGDNVDFIKQITNNQDFINNIINKLEGDFGNVGYDKDQNKFFYLKDGKVEWIEWSDLDTVNVSFAFDTAKENLIITDSKGNTVQITTDELGKTIANNSVFVTNLTENKEFITKLGDNVDFIKQITNNQDFINNIINKLEGDFGNVGYDKDQNKFFYLKDGKVEWIEWSDLDTVNVSFAFDTAKENLIITDSKGNTVQITTDELGKTIANNSVFVTNLTENKEFITKLGDNVDFIKQITNNQDFINNIINKLEGDFGNVGYDKDQNKFFYLKDGKVEWIEWSDLDTVNVSFAFDTAKENLIITDSKGNTVQITTDELGKTIANNSVFVTNLTENKEFITKLGDNVDFIKQITNNQDFINNIINKLEGDFGNVGYDKDQNKFFYLKDGKVEWIEWSDLDTVNVSFAFDTAKENLIITDSKGNTVQITTDELGKTIANNSVFVTNLTENKEFITKLGDNVDFIKQITNNQDFINNIINKLEGDFGNVGYDKDQNKFFYLKDGKVEWIEWSDLDTVNVSFAFDTAKENLIITDSKGNTVQITTDELGKTIANNSVFVTNLTENKEFITKLGDNVDFIKQITNNQDFINNIINKLEGDFGNVGYDKDQNKFFYLKDGKVEWIEWSDLDTVNVSFAFDTAKENLIITDSKGNTVQITTDELGKTIANNSVFVTNLTENKEFITKLGDNVDFIKQITNNQDFINNIINKLEGDFGNVGYDKDQNKFFYLKDGKVEWIEWSDLDTVNVSFAFDTAKENLIITDSKGNTVQITTDELGKTIANNSVFVTNLTENKEFITKLGDNVDFIKQITNNQDFINNIINKLEGDFGNVGYDKDQNKFFYLKDGKVEWIEWSDLDTVNVSFAFDTAKENLIITDSKGNTVQITTDELGKTIANNDTFVTNLVDNTKFITELTNKEEFINNIINKLEGTYGNVIYNELTKEFTYIKEDNSIVTIDWSEVVKLTETETTLVAEKDVNGKLTGKYTYTNEKSVVTEIDVVQSVLDNSKTIFQDNSVITEIINQIEKEAKAGTVTVIEKDGDFIFNWKDKDDKSIDKSLKELIKENSLIASLVTRENGNKNNVKAGFVFKDGSNNAEVVFTETLTELEKGFSTHTIGTEEIQLKEYYFIDESETRDDVIIKVSETIIDEFDKLVKFDNVKNTLNTFISNTAGDVSVEKVGEDIIIKNKADLEVNLSDEIKAKETLTALRYVTRTVQEGTNSINKSFLIYTPERGQDQEIDLTTLIESNETLTSFLTKEVAGVKQSAVYIYTDENKAQWEINIPEELKNSNEFNEYLKNLIKSIPSSVVNYSTQEQIKPEQWLTTDKKVAQRVFDITLNTKTNVVAIPGDFADVILHARFISKTSNSITEGVIRKEVVGNETQIVLGTPGLITSYHPVGEYYLILEYVKK